MRQLVTMVMVWVVAIAVSAASPGDRDGRRRASGLYGARIAILGDSMTWIGGDSCQNPGGWTHYIKDMANPASIDIYARSGATWTNTVSTQGDTSYYSEVLADENVLYPQAIRLIDAARSDSRHIPDIVLLYAGANDAWFADRRPGIFDTTADNPSPYDRPSGCTSLRSSIRLVCGLLKGAFPKADIVLMTPTEMTKTTVDRIRKVSDIIAETGRELGLIVLRPDLDVDIRRNQESITFTNTVDGVHTNPKGAEMIARYVVSKLQ